MNCNGCRYLKDHKTEFFIKEDEFKYKCSHTECIYKYKGCSEKALYEHLVRKYHKRCQLYCQECDNKLSVNGLSETIINDNKLNQMKVFGN